jgi:hypothetical protein
MVMMRRERIEKRVAKKPIRRVEVLPLDPRDPDIVRAKQMLERRRDRRTTA